MREVIEVVKCDICGKVITPGAAVYTVGIAEKIGERIRNTGLYSYPDFCEDCAVLVDKKVLGFWKTDMAEIENEIEAAKKDAESVPGVPDPERAESESGTIPGKSDAVPDESGTSPDESGVTPARIYMADAQPDKEAVPDKPSESEAKPEPEPSEPKPKPPAKPAKVRKRFRHDPVEDLDAKIIALIKQGRTTDEIKSELRVASRRVTEVRRAYGLMRAPAYRQIGGASDE